MTVALVVASCSSLPSYPVVTSPINDAAVYEDGFYVAEYHDGTATVALGPTYSADRWKIDCSVDAMADKRECSIYFKQGGPFVFYGFSSKPQSICISGHDFPGRTGQIRIDDRKPLTTDKDGCISASRVLDQMTSGTMFISRSYHWPYDYPVDERVSLFGLTKALAVVDRIRVK